MNQFTSDLRNIEEVYKNEYESIDKGKNYFIPIYQRDFTWTFKDIEKLIKDINEALDNKNDNVYQQYFIGGIVLSRDSILGTSRSTKSLEVIDGQQRLTSIAIILASLFQQLSFTGREFGPKQNFVEKLIERIKPLIKYQKSNSTTFEVEDMYRIERSDELTDIYQLIVNSLLESYVKSILKLKENITDPKESHKYKYKSKLIDIVHKVNKIFADYDNDKLLNFTLQLLENTFIVATKTIDIDTGFLVFEKLNDNGKQLEPNDLLKNFLFSEAKRDEYEEIDREWQAFIGELNSVNNNMTPKEFLEQYLISQGKQFSKRNDKLFTILKDQIFKKHSMTSSSMLNDLKRTAIEYSELKKNPIVFKYLSLLNFKLGYLIFLSIYKKTSKNKYEENINNILIQVLRLGFVYIITDYSKLLSKKVPEICEKMNSFDSDNISDILNKLKEIIDDNVKYLNDEFEETISRSNLFSRRQNLTKFLLNVLNFHICGQKFNEESKNIYLTRVLPLPDKFENFDFNQFQDIDIDNIKNVANQIGNLTLTKYMENDSFESYNFDQRKLELSDNAKFFILKDEIIITDFISWGMQTIEKRTRDFTKKAISIFVNGDFDTSFFQTTYFHIELAKNKNAVMVPIDNKQYKVLKGSICNDSEVEYEWSHGNLKDELMNSKIIIKNNDYLTFNQDYIFSSPSAAASIVTARQSPGPIEWKNIHGITFKDAEL